MSAPTGYHAPVVLADEREKRARKQRPYPAVCDHLPAPEPVEQPNGRAAAIACAGVVGVLFLIALVVVIVRASLKG